MPELTSVLDVVTVFPDRARVTRRGRVALEPGLHRLDFSGLPMSLAADSVRAAGKGTARARLLGVSLQVVHFTATPAEAARELEAKIQSVADEEADLSGQAEGLGKARKALDGLAEQSGVFARGLALRDRSIQDQGAIFDFIAERGRILQAEVFAVSRKRRDLAKELDRLQRELGRLRATRPRERHRASVEVEVISAGELEIELTYVVQPARWQPLYDLRLMGGEIEATYLAEVTQSTGEDWADVALTLSTARPALALVIPELEPWYVGPRPPRPETRTRGAVAGAAAAAPMAMRMRSAPEEDEESFEGVLEEAPLELPAASVSESGAALTYQIPNRADVPDGGDPRK